MFQPSQLFTPKPPPPRFLFVTVNRRCNLRCQHCQFWTRDDADHDTYILPSRTGELLHEYQQLSRGQGSVVICGGESMLDPEVYFGVSETCRRLDLKSISVVNGTQIQSPEMAERMILSGPDEISISLNSHRQELHDETRGKPGAFHQATQAIRLLIEARTRLQRPSTRIYVMGLIFDQNYQELDAFYHFVLNTLGADKLKLNFLQPSFGQRGEVDPFYAKHCHVDPDELRKVIDHCDQKYALGSIPNCATKPSCISAPCNPARINTKAGVPAFKLQNTSATATNATSWWMNTEPPDFVSLTVSRVPP
ncbi:MAG: radical SAM protein [Blastochloris sp.]|nr:radical SAM protein [Blastochloris sp.]